jgi:hypothetical protein
MYLFSVGKKQNLSTKPQEYWSIGVLEYWSNGITKAEPHWP